MDIHQMEYFIAVCDHHGITPAAEALFLTPQALSKSIHKLEVELDAPLFIREKSGLSLTPFGEKALIEIRRLTEEFHTTKQRLHQIAAQEKGQLRLACAFGVPNALPLEALQNELSPLGIRLDIMELPDLLAEEMVQREVVDLALTIGPPSSPELVRAIPLRRDQLCAVLNACHPLCQKEQISVTDLAGEQVITKSPYFRSYHILDEAAKSKGVTLSYALCSPDELRYIKLLEANKGIGIGINCMNTPQLMVSRSTVVRPFEEDLPWDIYLTLHKGHYLSTAARKTIERILEWKDPTPHE